MVWFTNKCLGWLLCLSFVLFASFTLVLWFDIQGLSRYVVAAILAFEEEFLDLFTDLFVFITLGYTVCCLYI